MINQKKKKKISKKEEKNLIDKLYKEKIGLKEKENK